MPELHTEECNHIYTSGNHIDGTVFLRCGKQYEAVKMKETKENTNWESQFNNEFKHVGFIPENKAHILAFIRSVESAAYTRGQEDLRLLYTDY